MSAARIFRAAGRSIERAARAATASSSSSLARGVSSSSSADADEDAPTTSFGFRDVRVEEKQGLVRDVFEKVAPSYDLMNDFMSAGVHRLWKDYLVDKVGVFPGMTHLDVAGGTGDVAFRVLRELRRAEEKARRGGGGGGGGGGRARDFDPGRVIVSDINPAMLAEGRTRARGRGLMGLNAVDAKGDALLAKLEFVEGNAESLPFEDASVDVYTIAFGLRNVTNAKAALRDALRLLKPGGRFMCLEFSHVTQEPLRSMYDLYSFNVIPALGELVAKDEASYRYLVESIRKFPKQRELEDMMRDVGFKSVSHDNLTGGVVAIHEGFKL
jgi:2-methoxy-6-polyprenyl-1,4-benzoquinol methylase